MQRFTKLTTGAIALMTLGFGASTAMADCAGYTSMQPAVLANFVDENSTGKLIVVEDGAQLATMIDPATGDDGVLRDDDGTIMAFNDSDVLGDNATSWTLADADMHSVFNGGQPWILATETSQQLPVGVGVGDSLFVTNKDEAARMSFNWTVAYTDAENPTGASGQYTLEIILASLATDLDPASWTANGSLVASSS